MKPHQILFTISFIFAASFTNAKPWQKVLLTPTEKTKVISVPEGKIIEFHEYTYSESFKTELNFGDGVVDESFFTPIHQQKNRD
jgi:hypothetical protein